MKISFETYIKTVKKVKKKQISHVGRGKKEMFLQHDDATPRKLVLPLKWQ